MIYSGIDWPKCPHCGCLINSWDYIPATAIMHDMRFGFEMVCPGAYQKKCGKKFSATAKARLVFESLSEDGSDKDNQ